jgi:hypothetical protein
MQITVTTKGNLSDKEEYSFEEMAKEPGVYAISPDGPNHWLSEVWFVCLELGGCRREVFFIDERENNFLIADDSWADYSFVKTAAEVNVRFEN